MLYTCVLTPGADLFVSHNAPEICILGDDRMMRPGMATLALVFLIGSTAFAQEVPRQELSGPDIYDEWKTIHADIKTFYRAKDEDEFRSGPTGSGSFVTEEGHLLTATHVIKHPTEQVYSGYDNQKKESIFKPIAEYKYEVTLAHLNRKFCAKSLGWSRETDLAILKVEGLEARDFRVARIGDPKKLRVGERAHAIGTPLGQSKTFTTGTISKFDALTTWIRFKELQTDAAVNPGNSGGALINRFGELVGVVLNKHFGHDNMGFALGINYYDFSKYSKEGEIKSPEIGLKILMDVPVRRGKDNPHFEDLAKLHELTGMNSRHDQTNLTNLYKIMNDYPVVIVGIDEDSIAGKMKVFKRGDVITEFNGEEIKSSRQLLRILIGYDTAKPIEIKIARFEEARRKDLTMKLNLKKSASKKKTEKKEQPEEEQD